MAFTPVENIALIMIVVGLIKMVVLLVKPKAWMNLAKKVYSKPNVTSLVALVLAAVVFYYLIQAGISVVQILAVAAFVALLIMVALAKEVGPLMKKYEVMIKKGNLWKEYWLYSLIWVILLVWGIKELFF
tara:strand:+ start:638 stop:1027 length:390 start_codon:yes stop_codon:yes gene_type:complete